MPYALFPDMSTKSGKSAKAKSEKTKSNKSRRFLDEEGSMGFDENMSMDLLVSGNSLTFRSDAKSSKTVIVQSKSSKGEEVTAISKGQDVIVESSSSKDGDVIAESKSNKEGTSIKGKAHRSIDLLDTEDTAPLKSLSYIEFTRAQVPASANAPSEESSGSKAFASVAIACLIAASAIAMN